MNSILLDSSNTQTISSFPWRRPFQTKTIGVLEQARMPK